MKRSGNDPRPEPARALKKLTFGALLLFLTCIPSTVSTAEESLAGQLIVATPEMSDPRFFQAVVFIVRHDQDGVMGLVVNKPVARGPIADLLKSMGKNPGEANGEITLHYGGPVEPAKGFILHSDDYRVDGTIAVGAGIALTGDVEVLRAISLGQGPRRSLFVMGYAGWAPGQLEAEMKAGAWFSIPAAEDLVLGNDWKSKWNHAMEKRKIEL